MAHYTLPYFGINFQSMAKSAVIQAQKVPTLLKIRRLRRGLLLFVCFSVAIRPYVAKIYILNFTCQFFEIFVPSALETVPTLLQLLEV